MKRSTLLLLLAALAVAVPALMACSTTCKAPYCDYHFSGEVGL
jgi:hypothetical protein